MKLPKNMINMWNERQKINAMELKLWIEVCKLNVVSQKLFTHYFVPHLFIQHSLSLVHISEIKLFILKSENY